MKKKILSLLLAMLLLLGLVPPAALADGSRSQRENMLTIAESQLGYRETAENYTKYGKWYGMDGQPWCAMFVSWCARRAGVPQSVIPNFASCTYGGMKWFREQGRWKNADYTPRGGDLVFFDFEDEDGGGRDGLAEHVAIVEYATGDTIHTIEGNTDNEMVERRERPRNEDVLGFGVPAYGSISSAAGEISVGAVAVPQSLWKGESFSISGKISSNSKINWLYIDIRDPDGHFYQAVQTDPEKMSVDLSGPGSPIKFSELPTGRYSLYIEATDSAYNFVHKSYPFAVYGDSYEIVYDANGGESAPEAQTKLHNTPVRLNAKGPDRTGYSFLGWSTAPDAVAAEYAPGAEYTDNFSVKLYAVWQANSYTVTFESDGEELLSAEKLFGSPYGELPEAPEKAHEKFIGWYTLPDGGAKITPDTAVSTASDHSLYARYSCVHEFERETVEPSCTERGCTLSTCVYCGYAVSSDFVAALGHSYEKGICTRCGEKLSFSDVDADGAHAPYAVAIDWAVAEGVANGYADGSFRPDAACTRAQVVTFLWRAAGSPEPENGSNPFSDVKNEGGLKPYYKAILWAVEQGITTGKTAHTFEPDAGCTRAQFVTFLWRYKGSPAQSADNPFTDVSQNAYYDAILWAYSAGVTQGYGGGQFRPEKLCTRAQVVTFIYRAT